MAPPSLPAPASPRVGVSKEPRRAGRRGKEGSVRRDPLLLSLRLVGGRRSPLEGWGTLLAGLPAGGVSRQLGSGLPPT